MAYTVKQVAELSGVSVRTLHFYDEEGLLNPAYLGANGYRFYEEPQILILQQILFYRELGFELKRIKRILRRPDFEKVEALQSHREVLEKNLTRTRTLIDTIDKTIQHLKGTRQMRTEEMFTGFSVAAGEDRFDEQTKLGGEPQECKVSGKDTAGAMCVFEFNGSGSGPRVAHRDQDEWLYVIEGEIHVEAGSERLRLGPGGSVFIPRGSAHAWSTATGQPVTVINTYHPAGNIEQFFREVGKYNGKPHIHEAMNIDEFRAFFSKFGMDLLGPPQVGEWKVDDAGRITGPVSGSGGMDY